MRGMKGGSEMSDKKPAAPYKEVTFKGRTYKRPGISPARAAMVQTKTVLTPGQHGTDENPIVLNGIPYVYSSTGKLVRRLDFDPKTMEIFVLPPKSVLTDEQISMLKKAMEMPVVYDDDCPKSTPEQLEKFRQYGVARNKKRREQMTAM